MQSLNTRGIASWDDEIGLRESSFLPLNEFIHPVPLLALLALAVNDHYLKGAGICAPSITGKLSDFAGIIYFPLLLTALFDTLLFGVHRLGSVFGVALKIDYVLRRWKLLAACAVTALIFSAIQLSPMATELYIRALGRIGFDSYVTRDITDLFALAALPIPYMIGKYRMRQREERLDVLAASQLP